MPPIRSPSVQIPPPGGKQRVAGLCCSLVIMLNQPESYHCPPPGPAPDLRLMPHQGDERERERERESLDQALSPATSTKFDS